MFLFFFFSLIGAATWQDALEGLDFELIREDAAAISIERVSNSSGSESTRLYLKQQLESVDFRVRFESFERETPHGLKTFTNVVADNGGGRKGGGGERLVVAAHYDSKFFEPPRHFVATTDSAVSCALLLDLARLVSRLSSSTTNSGASSRRRRRKLHLQLIFFDGEEAFGEWTRDDSLYGSRHMAARWSDADAAAVRVFVLLDLIGAAAPAIYCTQRSSLDEHRRLVAIERALTTRGVVRSAAAIFRAQALDPVGLEDDHTPFVERFPSMRVLHLIPLPFPSVWHKDDDTMLVVDSAATLDFQRTIRVFVAEQLNLIARL